MRKRIKARVKRKPLVSLDFAREIYLKGKWLTEYVHSVQDSTVTRVRICNISYFGKLYFVVYYDFGSCGDIKECIEL